jgi:hypothetical protein
VSSERNLLKRLRAIADGFGSPLTAHRSQSL